MTMWKVSAAAASHPHNCTIEGIRSTCGGVCCKVQKFWPPSSGEGGCPRLGPEGCTLTMQQRPVECHLYPFRPNTNGTLVRHFGAAMGRPCGECARTGPMLWDAMKGNMVHLFGEAEWERVRAEIVQGHDTYLQVPDWVEAQMAEEGAMAEANLPPPLDRLIGDGERLEYHTHRTSLPIVEGP